MIYKTLLKALYDSCQERFLIECGNNTVITTVNQKENNPKSQPELKVTEKPNYLKRGNGAN